MLAVKTDFHSQATRSLVWKDIASVATEDILSVATAGMSFAEEISSVATEEMSSVATKEMSSAATEEKSSVATEDISLVGMCKNWVFPMPERVCHGSPWAHTSGKRSHGLQEGF